MKTRGAPGAQGASQSRTRWRDHYNAWSRHHRLSAADSLQRLMDHPWSSLLTWLVIGIALALPLGMNVALENARQVSANWDQPSQVSLFLHEGISEEAASLLRDTLQKRADIADVALVTREQALAEFSSLSGFGDVLSSLDENPLPHLLLVSPKAAPGSLAVQGIQEKLQALPEVEQAVLDMAWVQRLASLMVLSRRIVFVVGALLVLGVILILGNTIRLAIENRRDEIVIVKLVGGSNAFVRRPFLYTGLWYGVGGGACAALLISAALWYLGGAVKGLALLYGSDFELQGLGVMGGLNLVVLGGLLGLAGAWLAVSRHLNAIEPQ